MKKSLTMEEEIFINQFTQKLHSLETMEKWFVQKDEPYKREIILNLLNMVIQSHPTYEEMSTAIAYLKKNSSTSAVKLLNTRRPFAKYGYELADLPECELLNSFDILLVTLSIADNRRKKEECSGGCNHWWHKDLSDQSVLLQLKHNC